MAKKNKKGATKVPDDIKKRISDLSKQKGIDLKILQKKFFEIMKNDPECVAQKDKEVKMRIASGLLMAENIVSSGPQFAVCVRAFSGKRITPKKKTAVANVYGFTYRLDEDGELDEDEPEYTIITLWKDSASASDKLEKGKIYKASLIEGDDQPEWGRDLFTTNTEFEPVDKLKNEADSWDSFMDELRDMDVGVTTSNIDRRISTDKCDLRFIRGTAMQVSVDQEKKKATLHLNDGRTDRDIIVFYPFSEADFGNGSEIECWGEIAENDKGEIRMNCHFIEVIAPTPLTLKPKPVADVKEADVDDSEEIDMGDDEDDEEE